MSETEKALHAALALAWELLKDPTVKWVITDGGRGHLGEAARYHAALKAARDASHKAGEGTI